MNKDETIQGTSEERAVRAPSSGPSDVVSEARAPGVEHYFSAAPATPMETRTITVEIDGEEVEVVTAPGIFSPGHIDTGTNVLLKEMQVPPNGYLLDLGCGWGPIALTMAKRNPKATVWAVDVNERSLDLARQNAQKLGLSNVRCVFPEQVPDDIMFSEIWSNPPIRVGKDVLHGLMLRWLPRLVEGSSAYLVVQKNLGSDSLQKWLNEQFSESNPEALMQANTVRAATSKGFRVLEVIRSEQI